jgi:hypothetical protein
MSVTTPLPGLGFYEQPLAVPERLTPAEAKDLFDRGERIFVVRAGYLPHPADQRDETFLLYSYRAAHWWEFILPLEEVPAWSGARLFQIWSRILDHALRQPYVPFGRRPGRALDFYRFVPPEVQAVPAPPPQRGRPYELRQSQPSGYYYFNRYDDTTRPAMPPANRRRRPPLKPPDPDAGLSPVEAAAARRRRLLETPAGADAAQRPGHQHPGGARRHPGRPAARPELRHPDGMKNFGSKTLREVRSVVRGLGLEPPASWDKPPTAPRPPRRRGEIIGLYGDH